MNDRVKKLGQPVLAPETENWGGKGANLLELAQFNNVPPGFVVNSEAYDQFTQQQEIQNLEWIDQQGDVNLDWIQENTGKNEITLEEIQNTTQEVFTNNPVPEPYEQAINQALEQHEPIYDETEFFTRSSAVNEDGENNSGAGRLESFGPLTTTDEILDGTKKVFASAFDEKAIQYLTENNMESFGGVATVIQEKINPQFGGVIYSSDPNGNPNEVYMELNETPWQVVEDDIRDIIRVDKDALPTGREEQTPFNYKNNTEENGEPLPNSTQVTRIAGTAVDIEETYDSPMDIEAAYDTQGNLWILQGRPITVEGFNQPEFDIPGEINPPTNQKIAESEIVRNAGTLEAPAVVIDDADPAGEYQLEGNLRNYNEEFQDGYIIVTPVMNEEIENRTGNAEGLIASRGGKTSHASTVADENGLLYMGALETTPEDYLEHGENLYMAVNGHEGVLYEGGGDTL